MRQPIIPIRMDSKLSPGTGIVILLGVSTVFAANHVAARVAFDHGASVAAGVVVRSADDEPPSDGGVRREPEPQPVSG